ncbi:hypothetical protein [Deinococcus multiflagellatus]|uniref:Uncharacterized protein n=1 Tax=Deinococcus multiflagellatus TaxID=1656887 RepID=A0ABW1ZLL0_9DEIO
MRRLPLLLTLGLLTAGTLTACTGTEETPPPCAWWCWTARPPCVP